MRTIDEMTDLIISCRNGKEWSWNSFWIKIVGKKIPPTKTLADVYYKRNRVMFKNLINEKMTKRETCRQLIIPKPDEGVILVSTKEIKITVDKIRMRKEVNTTRRTIKKYQNIIDSLDASDRDKIAAQRQISHYLKTLDKKLQKTLKGNTQKKISKKSLKKRTK